MSLKDSKQQHYRDHEHDWRLAKDFYEAEDVTHHLVQGKYEADGAFAARKRMARGANPYTRQIIGRLTDQLILRSDDVERSLGPIPSGYLENAGPEQESHALQMHTLANYLLLYGEAWLQVVPGDGATLRVLSPLSVPRWKDNRVLTLGEAARPDVPLSESEERDTTFTVNTPRGFTTFMFQKNDAGKEERVQIDSGTFSPDDTDRFFVDRSGNPTPPLKRITLPWDSTLGIQLAKTHLQMFRLESQVDGRLHTPIDLKSMLYATYHLLVTPT